MTYGLVEVGLCRRCGQPDFLYVHSEVPRIHTYCLDCLVRATDIDTSLDPLPTVSTFPLLGTTEKCQACHKPAFPHEDSDKWELVESHLADRTKIMVHKNCTMRYECSACHLTYAQAGRRQWFQEPTGDSIPLDLFTDMTRLEGEWHCNNCLQAQYQLRGGEHNFMYCDNCENTVHNSNTGEYRGNTYCMNCISDNVYDCDNCNRQYWDGDDHDCDDDDGSSNVIHSYGYKPNPIFFGAGSYHMGFELEVEARSNSRYDNASLAQDTLGAHAYMKADGSLNNGFEIVTHPHTLEHYQKEFDWSVLLKLRDSGCRSWNTTTCGLHVHVSRTAFGGVVSYDTTASEILRMQAHQLRFMKLIYDNERQVTRIAGRSSTSYASFSDKGQLVPKVKHGYSERGHFSAVNVENYATLEIRVFKGSLRKERVLSALEFITAGVEYTRNLKVTGSNTALSWLRFAAYVSQEAVTYPNLALIMSESFTSDNTPSDNDN